MFHHSGGSQGSTPNHPPKPLPPASHHVCTQGAAASSHHAWARHENQLDDGVFHLCRPFLIAYSSVGGHRRDGRLQVAPVAMSSDHFSSVAGSFPTQPSRRRLLQHGGFSAQGRQRHWRLPGKREASGAGVGGWGGGDYAQEGRAADETYACLSPCQRSDIQF